MKRFNKLFFILIGVISVLSMSSCSKVPAGNVGIKFYLLGGEKGVDYEPLSPGRYWIGVNEELYLFPTRMQNKTWTNDVREDSEEKEGFEFQSCEGMKLTANVGIEYNVKAVDVPPVFEMYKKGLDEITDKVLRNATRNAFNMASSTRTAEQMYGKGKIAFLSEVSKLVKQKAYEKHITVSDVYLIGNIGIPSSVTDALNMKIKANQLAEQKENELAGATADAKKVVAKAEGDAQAILTKAKAQAEANRLINASITKTLVDYEKIKKWDGKMPQVTGSGGTLVNLK